MESLVFLRNLAGFGVEPGQLSVLQLVVRAILIYMAGLAIIRFANDRFVGKRAAFDIILGFILGSLLSRAINGSGPLLGTLTAAGALLAVHWILAALGIRFRALANLIKGKPLLLVENGRIRPREMRASNIGVDDLEEALRLRGQVADVSAVVEARIERSGDISVVPGTAPPRVIEVGVESGVKTVRIELVQP